MKIFTTCSQCKSYELLTANYFEDYIAKAHCSCGFENTIIIQNQKFEVLLESAIIAMQEGYTIEAAASFSAAYERFFEFAIKVICKRKRS